HAHAQLAAALADTQPAQALEHYQTAVKLAPDNENWQKMLGQFLISRQRIDPTFPTPDTYDALYGMGRARVDANDFDGAITAFRQALAKRPAAPRPRVYLGICYAGKQDHQLARRACEEILADAGVEPSVAGLAWYGLALVSAVQGNLDEALPSLRRS